MQSLSEPLLLLAQRVHILPGRESVEGLVVEGGRVAAAGTEAQCRAAAPRRARLLHFPHATITPGLTDSHVHLTLWAMRRRQVSLEDAPDVHGGVRLVAEYAARENGEWIRGGGWDRHRWGRLPTREDLDLLLPERPVYLESHDTHAVWLNSAALVRCGIDRSTSDPPGGRIERDPESGDPTGVLLENAIRLAAVRVPAPASSEVDDALVAAQHEAHRAGITGVHSVEVSGLADFSRLERDDLLRLRVLQHIPLDHLEAAADLGLSSGWRSPGVPGGRAWIRLGGVKIFLDGALGSRTAWMRDPYEGADEDHGISTLGREEFRSVLQRMERIGFAATVHAIGDAAIELAIEELERVPPPAVLPHRIEHLQLCPPELRRRVAESGIIASMQPVHLRSDIAAADRHWGARASAAFCFRPLLEAGAVLAFGSDVPVETIDPRQGLFSAVRRVDWKGEPEQGWYPENAVSPGDALRAYTVGPARAAGVGSRSGRLLPGFDADLVVWDRDPLSCAPDELLEMQPLLVLVAGEVVAGGIAEAA
jgi:predicted amidohydrolase YtcJ